MELKETNQDEQNQLSLVICDIDHTLVVKHQALTLRAKAVIDKLQKHGVYFGIASGRSLPEIRRMISSWGLCSVDVIVGLNGGVLWDGVTNQEYEYFKLQKTVIKEIMTMMKQFDHNPLIYRNDQMLCGTVDDIVKLSSQTAQMKAVQAKHDSEFYQEELAKIMFRVNEDDMKQIEEYLACHPSPAYHAFKTQASLIEFSDRRCSKATALKQFCEKHDLDRTSVMAFGDTTNDNDMLVYAGSGVCMKNGSEDTKQIADDITEQPCDKDGWAAYMEHHILQPRGWNS